MTFAPGPYDFSGRKVRAGTYTVPHRVTVYGKSIGNAAEGWPYRDRTVFEKTVDQQVTVKSAAACKKANKKVKAAKAKVKKAHGKKAMKKAKKKLKRAKQQKKLAC